VYLKIEKYLEEVRYLVQEYLKEPPAHQEHLHIGNIDIPIFVGFQIVQTVFRKLQLAQNSIFCDNGLIMNNNNYYYKLWCEN
jgi:hypothetical protein